MKKKELLAKIKVNEDHWLRLSEELDTLKSTFLPIVEAFNEPSVDNRISQLEESVESLNKQLFTVEMNPRIFNKPNPEPIFMDIPNFYPDKYIRLHVVNKNNIKVFIDFDKIWVDIEETLNNYEFGNNIVTIRDGLFKKWNKK